MKLRYLALLFLIICAVIVLEKQHSSLYSPARTETDQNKAGSQIEASESFTAPEVKKVAGPEGHVSVAIDETSLADQDLTSFSTLAHWNFEPENPSTPPEPIACLHNKKIAVIGFMFPLTEGEEIKAFCLMATTQTCCYGPRPQYNQFILVETKKPVPFERLKPVKVVGSFFAEPNYQDGYIYRMEADKVIPAQSRLLEAPLNEIASVTRLSWNLIALQQPFKPAQSMAEMLENIRLSPELQNLENSEVSVDGYFIGGGTTTAGEKLFLIGSDSWDGCCMGVPPHLFNSITIKPASGVEEPPLWMGKVAFKGKAVVNRKEQWQERSLITLEEARIFTSADP